MQWTWTSVRVPESLGLLRQRSWVSSVGWLVQVRQQRLAAFLTGVVGKFHCDWLGGAWWFLSIQTFNGLLSFNAPVKSDEAHTSGHAWTTQKSTVNLTRLGPVLWQTNLVNYNCCTIDWTERIWLTGHGNRHTMKHCNLAIHWFRQQKTFVWNFQVAFN